MKTRKKQEKKRKEKEKKTKKKTKTKRRDITVKMKREQRRRRGNENQCKAGGELSIMVLGRSQGLLWGAWEVPKTDDVFSERSGRVLGGSWGGFGALRWSLGRSWEVKMLLFR